MPAAAPAPGLLRGNGPVIIAVALAAFFVLARVTSNSDCAPCPGVPSTGQGDTGSLRHDKCPVVECPNENQPASASCPTCVACPTCPAVAACSAAPTVSCAGNTVMPRRISLLVPVQGQVDGVMKLWATALANARDKDNVELVMRANDDASESTTVATLRMLASTDKRVKLVVGPRAPFTVAVNDAAGVATGELLAVTTPDVFFTSGAWDSAVTADLGGSTDQIGVLTLRTAAGASSPPQLLVVHRAWVATTGYVLPPYFRTLAPAASWVDTVARSVGRTRPLAGVTIDATGVTPIPDTLLTQLSAAMEFDTTKVREALTAKGVPVPPPAAQPSVSAPPSTALVVAAQQWRGGEYPSAVGTVIPSRRFPAVRTLANEQDWQNSPVPLQGQVNLQTTFGQALHQMARRPDVHLVLEVGTWFGGGSSWCIAQGLRQTMADASGARPDKWMFTVELFGEAYEYASRTLARLPVTCFLGGTVGNEGYLRPEEIPAEEKNEHYQLYYARDVELAKTAPRLLPELCSRYDFDMVLLDGNEYTGWAEFQVVRDSCRPRFLALHDCGTLKTRRVQAFLDAHTDRWRKIQQGQDQAAWAIYEDLSPSLPPPTA